MTGASGEDLETLVRRTVARCTGGSVTAIEPLPAQLGLRRFLRVSVSGAPCATLIARVELPEDPAGRPAGNAPEPPLEPIRALLERHGLPVPASLGHDARAGIDLLEDVGDRSLRDAASSADAAHRRRLYESVCADLPRLQRIGDPGAGVAAFERQLDPSLIDYKADLFVRHALRDVRPGARACTLEAFGIVAEAVRTAPLRLAHRDFQSANIHLRADDAPVWIDLQGAFLAPPEYDLVCLLRDSYVELDDLEVAHQLERIRPELPDAPSPEVFEWRFDLLTLSRKGKDLARFLQASIERGDERFLRYAPATARAIRAAALRAARHDPRLADFAQICHEELASTCAQ